MSYPVHIKQGNIYSGYNLSNVENIDELPTAVSVSKDDLLIINDGTESKKATIEDVVSATNGYWMNIRLGSSFADREASVKAIADYIYTTAPVGNYRFGANAKYSWIGIYQKFDDNSAIVLITRAEANQTYQISIGSDGTKNYFRIASTEVFNK